MRISDWSSDVCPSDLVRRDLRGHLHGSRSVSGPGTDAPPIRVRGLRTAFGPKVIHDDLDLEVRSGEILGVVGGSGSGKRSEEHTSELQSLMRISYAVFCLKKKKKNTIINNT